jgi:spore maturation protein CgeB
LRIIIPNYCTPDSFEENVSETLKVMGHEVLTMGSMSIHKKSSPFYRFYKDVKKKLLKTQTDQEKWLLLQITIFKPELIISLTQGLAEEVLHIARRQGIKAVSWWGDTAANMSGKGLCHKEWDLLFIKDHYAAFKLRTLNLPAIQLYEAMNPMWHKPVANQKNNQIVIAGSFYDYRHYLTTLLIERDVEVGLYGARLPVWADREIKKRHTGQFITRDKKSQIFGAALAVLNSTGMSEFASINCRTFEIAGCGGLPIMEYRPGIEECFEPEKEILLYKNLDELLSIIETAKNNPVKMKAIRSAASKRAIEFHTYKHRLEIILKHVKELS